MGEGWSADLKSRQEPLVLGEDFLVIKVSGRDTPLWQLETYPPPPSQQSCDYPPWRPLGCVSIADSGNLSQLTYLIIGRVYGPNTVTILGKRKAQFLPRKCVRAKAHAEKRNKKSSRVTGVMGSQISEFKSLDGTLKVTQCYQERMLKTWVDGFVSKLKKLKRTESTENNVSAKGCWGQIREDSCFSLNICTF